MDRIDCLPPPYIASDFTNHEVSGRFQHRSESMEYIITDDGTEIPRKICCERCKSCLSSCFVFRRVLCYLAAFSLSCFVTSITLGVVKVPENSYLTISLMFAGLGLLLVTLVFIGWKFTPADHEPCHLLFGLGIYSIVRRGRSEQGSASRIQWMRDGLPPEFRYRRPPPTYTMSLQEYRLRSQGPTPQSPPPKYKMNATIRRIQIHTICQSQTGGFIERPPPYQESYSQTRSDECVNQTFRSDTVDDTPSHSTENSPEAIRLRTAQSTSLNDIISIGNDFTASLGEVTHL